MRRGKGRAAGGQGIEPDTVARSQVSSGANQATGPGASGGREEADRLRGLSSLGGEADSVGLGESNEELIPLFTEQIRRYIASLSVALARMDLFHLERQAHAMKSSCAYLGATQLALLADAIEQRAVSGRTGDLQALLNRMEAEWARVSAGLRRSGEE